MIRGTTSRECKQRCVCILIEDKAVCFAYARRKSVVDCVSPEATTDFSPMWSWTFGCGQVISGKASHIPQNTVRCCPSNVPWQRASFLNGRPSCRCTSSYIMATHKSTENGQCANDTAVAPCYQYWHTPRLSFVVAPQSYMRALRRLTDSLSFPPQVCHAILDRSWTPNTSVSAILGCVYGLLLYPDHDDPLDSTLALQMYDSNGEYEAAIIEHVKTQAR